MRRTKRSGSFILCLFINMLLNLDGLIPAAVLLILHFALGWSLGWTVIALGVWFIRLILWMSIIGWAGRCGATPDKPKENKNPYSSGQQYENSNSVLNRTSDN